MRGVRSAVVVVLLVLGVLDSFSLAANVTYDHRALVIDGKRRVLVSGSIHYPRSTPEVRFLCSWHLDVVLALRIFFISESVCGFWNFQMWPGIIQKSKDGGLDVIETYVFWNLHEPVRNQVHSWEFIDSRASYVLVLKNSFFVGLGDI